MQPAPLYLTKMLSQTIFSSDLKTTKPDRGQWPGTGAGGAAPGARHTPMGRNRSKCNDVCANHRCIYFCYFYRVWHLNLLPSGFPGPMLDLDFKYFGIVFGGFDVLEAGILEVGGVLYNEKAKCRDLFIPG